MSGNPNLQPVKKRKKHAPDRQQPEWLFPADSANPALKPHQEPTLKEKLEKQRSIDFLTRRAVGAPMKPAPPVQLLNLIGAFLAEYGFASTGRLFSTERQGRSKLDGWKDDTGGKLEKGMPTLGKIYKEWRKEWEERRLLEMTSSDEEDDAATKREKMLARKEEVEKQKRKANEDATSSSGSCSSEDSDAVMQDAPPTKRSAGKKASSSSASSSSSTTSSDSDADDEKEVPAAKNNTQKPKQNNLKRKASPSSSSSSASESGSTSEDEAPKSKKTKTSTNSSSSESDSSSNRGVQLRNSVREPVAKEAVQSSSVSSSGSGSSSESEPSSNAMAKKTPLPASSESDSSSDSDSDSSSDNDNKNKPLISSDTSATLSDGPKKVSPANSESGSSSNDSATDPKAKAAKTKTKGKTVKKSPPIPAAQLPRKTNAPFSRIPKDIKVDERLASNAYVPYDYAQKAHEDLIITKGKNFIKEKNKKKRGSYKGGYIDVEGKKGIKFDD
jgi:hypothetical protein